MKSLKDALEEYIVDNLDGLVCPDCSEGPDKCDCDNGVEIPSSRQ